MIINNEQYYLIKIENNDNYYISRNGSIYSTYINKILRLKTDGDGYKEVTFKLLGERKTLRVHRLVASTFLENQENLPYINHKNGIKGDNRVENLEWCTASYNNYHRFTINDIVNSNEDLFEVKNIKTNNLEYLNWAKLNKLVSHTFIRGIKNNICKTCYCIFERTSCGGIVVYYNGNIIKKFANAKEAADFYDVKVNSISYYLHRKMTRNQKFSLNNQIKYLGKKSSETIETTLFNGRE